MTLPDKALWKIVHEAGSNAPGDPRNAIAAEIRAIARIVELRGDKGLDLDPGETADWLLSEADLADAVDEPG